MLITISLGEREGFAMTSVPAGVAPTKNDQIVFDITNGKSAGGFGHPTCGGHEDQVATTLAPTKAPVKSETKK